MRVVRWWLSLNIRSTLQVETITTPSLSSDTIHNNTPSNKAKGVEFWGVGAQWVKIREHTTVIKTDGHD